MRKVLAVATALVLSGCSVVKRAAPEPTFVQRVQLGSVHAVEREVQTPDVGVRATVAVGVSMVSHSRQRQQLGLVVKAPVTVKARWDADYEYTLTLPAATVPIYGRDKNNAEYFNVGFKPKVNWIYRGTAAHSEEVWADWRLNADGSVDVVWTYPYEKHEVKEVPARDAQTERIWLPPVESPNTFRRELIYTGRSGSSLSLVYREFSNDMARPAFSQALQYDISSDPVIGYQGARFRVISADNTGITYEVLAPLAPR